MATVCELNEQGKVLYSVGKYSEAMARFSEAASLDPSYQETYENMGVCYIMMGAYEKAETALKTVLKLNILLNSVLNGLSIEEINLAMIQSLKQQAGIHSELIASVIDAVAEVIHSEDEVKIYTSGATNIFRYPELSDKGKASEIISTFEEKQELTDLVNQTLENSDNKGIQVYIGQESPIQAMKDCSVVTATYELGEGLQGTIGIIGPKRMDYENVLKTLKTLTEQLDEIYNNKKKE